MANAKDLYILLGHSHWSRKTDNFLDVFVGKESVLKIDIALFHGQMKHTANIKKTITRWNKRDAISQLRNQECKESDHRTWCNKRNDGICHFGVVPESYKFASCTRYDVFHG